MGTAAVPLGLVPVASPTITKIVLVRCVPEDAGKRTVTVPVAPGARFKAGLLLLMIVVPNAPSSAFTLAAAMLPVFFTEIATR